MVTILRKLTAEIAITALLLVLLAVVTMVWYQVDARAQGLQDSFDDLHREMLQPLTMGQDYPPSWWREKIQGLEARYPELGRLESINPTLQTLLTSLKSQDFNMSASPDLGTRLIALQDLESLLEDLTRKSYRMYQISSITLFLLFITSLALFSFRLYRISMRVDSALHHKRILDSAMILQEKERYRLARELHDGVAQEIAHARMVAMTQDSSQGMGIVPPLDKALQEIRWLCGSLRVPQDPNRRLAHMVDETVSTFRERYATALDYVEAISDQTPWSHLQTFEINRIIQEGLVNIARHSKASHAALKLVETGTRLRILIEDSGRGLGSSPRGFGMEGISERATLLSGTAHWESPKEGGTRLLVEIPLPEKTNEHTPA